jgi:hypothetical protein
MPDRASKELLEQSVGSVDRERTFMREPSSPLISAAVCRGRAELSMPCLPMSGLPDTGQPMLGLPMWPTFAGAAPRTQLIFAAR